MNSEDEPFLFNLKSYEDFSQLEKIKEEDKPLNQKMKEIQENVDILKFGITPARVFNKLHEKMNVKINEKENNINNDLKNEEKSINIINKYIQKKIKEKVDFYFINTKIDNEIELVFVFINKIDIFKLKFGETKYIEISQKIEEILKLEPYENLLCEIFPEIYCIVRHIDNTISFISRNKIISIYQFYCLVTAVENKYNINTEESTCRELFIGDERGYLHLIEIIFEFNQNKKLYEIKNIKIKKSVKANEGRINGLLHNKRLNIIISWSEENEDYFCINNDYNLNIINIIKAQREICIKEIVVSKYDLIYISCYKKKYNYYKVYCYTLNGIKISFYDSTEKIIKCFVDEKITIIFLNNFGLSFYLYTFDEIYKDFFCNYINDSKEFKFQIYNCQYYPQNKKYLMICDDNKAYFCNDDKDVI